MIHHGKTDFNGSVRQAKRSLGLMFVNGSNVGNVLARKKRVWLFVTEESLNRTFKE